jgi:catechol 1,2-dioxygenase
MSLDVYDLAEPHAHDLILRADALPTQSYEDDIAYAEYLKNKTLKFLERPPTESDVLGPYFRPSPPYRAKVTPPHEPGVAMIITGRVWGFDTRRPLPGTIIDIWQADSEGHYDNEDPQHPPPSNSYKNRVRLTTDEKGGLEYETIHPGAYRMDPTTWRAPHIHYQVKHHNYKTLVTQLFFIGDSHQNTDPFFKASLAIRLERSEIHGKLIERGVFDVVLVRS